MTEFAFSAYHPAFKAPRNPWDSQRWSGLSSSGSAVSVAAGLGFGSTGSDTGGSLRWPTAANGGVGINPTFGRVSRTGVATSWEEHKSDLQTLMRTSLPVFWSTQQ